MALKNIIYVTCTILPSCLQGKSELQVGEQVKITLQPKNPLWPASLIATVIAVESTYGGRNYTFQFDDAVLNGGPLFQGCDVVSVTSYCCCDEMQDHVIAESNEDGTATIHNFDGETICVVACPPDDLPEGYVPSIGPDDEIIWGPPSGITYALAQTGQPFATDIHLNGSDGSVSTVKVPVLHDGVPTPGNYIPDAGGAVSIPITKTDFSTGGVPVNLGPVVIDLSSLVAGLNTLAGQVVTGFSYDAASNLYEITLQNGTVLSAPGIRIDTSVPGQVTITDAQGNLVTLPTQDTNTTYNLNQTAANPGGDILITLAGSDGSADSVVVPTRYPFIPPATYPLAGNTITLPVLRMSAGGVNLPEGDIILDLSSVTNGYGNGVAALNLVADPVDPCSEQLQLTTINGTTFNSGSLGGVNEVIVDPASTEHLVANGETFNGFGLEGENPTANAGIYLPADGGETRGTGPDFVKTISRKTGCVVLSEIVTGRRSGYTAVVDNKFHSDTPRYERDDHPFENVAAIPAGILGAPQVFRLQGGNGGDVIIPTGQTAALNFSEIHTLGHISLFAGIFRSSGCPDFVSFALLDAANFSGRLGDGLETTGNTHYFLVSESRFHVVVWNISTHSGYTGSAIQIDSSIGTLEFGNVITQGVATPLRCYLCDDSRFRGSATHADSVDGVHTVLIDLCSDVSVEIDEIRGGRHGIFVNRSARINVSGRYVVASRLSEFRGAGVIDVRGSNVEYAHDHCTIRFDQVVSFGQRPANVLTVFDRVHVRAYDTLFVSEYVGSHLDVCVFFVNHSNPGPPIQLIMHNCAARVADLQTPLFQVIAADLELYIHGTFKTNAVILTSFGTATLMTGTVELGENVA